MGRLVGRSPRLEFVGRKTSSSPPSSNGTLPGAVALPTLCGCLPHRLRAQRLLHAGRGNSLTRRAACSAAPARTHGRCGTRILAFSNGARGFTNPVFSFAYPATRLCPHCVIGGWLTRHGKSCED